MTCTFCKTVTASDYFLIGTSCVQSCPSGYFADLVADPTLTNLCSACSVGCIGCTSAGYSSCSSCTNNGATKLWLHYGTTTCDSICPSGEYMGSGVNDFQCLQCSATCLTCTGTSTNCVTCPSPNLLHQASPGVWTCVSVCQAGYYQDALNPVCNKCPTGCALCIDGTIAGGFGTQCSQCQTELTVAYYLISGTTTCSTSCPVGQFAGSSATANQCVLCATGCASCTAGTLNDCTSCGTAAGSPYYLAVGTTTCAVACPDGQYPDIISGTHHCLACSASCTKCSGSATACTFCKAPSGTNRFLLNGMCLMTCPQYFYGLISTNIAISNTCDACTPGCDVCTATGLNSCTVCGNDGTSDYYLAVGTTTCGVSCPNGEFMGTGNNLHKCLSCNV